MIDRPCDKWFHPPRQPSQLHGREPWALHCCRSAWGGGNCPELGDRCRSWRRRLSSGALFACCSPSPSRWAGARSMNHKQSLAAGKRLHRVWIIEVGALVVVVIGTSPLHALLLISLFPFFYFFLFLIYFRPCPFTYKFYFLFFF